MVRVDVQGPWATVHFPQRTVEWSERGHCWLTDKLVDIERDDSGNVEPIYEERCSGPMVHHSKVVGEAPIMVPASDAPLLRAGVVPTIYFERESRRGRVGYVYADDRRALLGVQHFALD